MTTATRRRVIARVILLSAGVSGAAAAAISNHEGGMTRLTGSEMATLVGGNDVQNFANKCCTQDPNCNPPSNWLCSNANGKPLTCNRNINGDQYSQTLNNQFICSGTLNGVTCQQATNMTVCLNSCACIYQQSTGNCVIYQAYCRPEASTAASCTPNCP